MGTKDWIEQHFTNDQHYLLPYTIVSSKSAQILQDHVEQLMTKGDWPLITIILFINMQQYYQSYPFFINDFAFNKKLLD